ncbi:lysophosphatidylserine lipase ABHD12-like isoform X2 [Macrosteles quadrilineatus]|uniref:lysophosphatidylserine lipase ABHD12-like isoform X2 n=1 Tax=Macrosteles quadrilineatus TaxID=74068 RepID=UPI0023E308A6|nr:lysophosphatidylserine lipase ABHD12-like isoform X2 [Macrosteles quadrilineatus]
MLKIITRCRVARPNLVLRGHRFFSGTYLPHHRNMNIFFKRRFIRRICFGTFIFALVCFLFVFVVVPFIFRYSYDMQRGLLFLTFVRVPNVDYNKPSNLGLVGARNLQLKTKDGLKIGVWHTLPVKHQLVAAAGQWLTGKDPSDQYNDWLRTETTIIYCHGNAGTRASDHRVRLYQILNQMNYHVIAFDYRGYADSTRVPTGEEGVVEDAKTVISWVLDRATSGQVFVWGHSLGTAIASHALAELEAEGRQVPGLILEAPFNNLSDEIREYPICQLFTWLPWFDFFFVDPVFDNRLRFQSDVNLRNVSAPILFLHAEDDMVVPYKLGKKLYNAVMGYRKDDKTVTEFVTFEYKMGHGHKFIYRDKRLPSILRKFIDTNQQRNQTKVR